MKMYTKVNTERYEYCVQTWTRLSDLAHRYSRIRAVRHYLFKEVISRNTKLFCFSYVYSMSQFFCSRNIRKTWLIRDIQNWECVWSKGSRSSRPVDLCRNSRKYLLKDMDTDCVPSLTRKCYMKQTRMKALLINNNASIHFSILHKFL